MSRLPNLRNTTDRFVEILLAAGFIITAAGLFWVFVLLDNSRRVSQDTQNAIIKTHEILLLCAGIETDVITMESASRGFVISVQDDFLAPFKEAVGGAHFKARALYNKVRADSAQRATAARVRKHVAERLRIARRQILAARSGASGSGHALVNSGQGLRLTTSIRNDLHSIRSRQETLLQERTSDNNLNLSRAADLSTIFGWMIGCTILGSAALSAFALGKRRQAVKQANATAMYTRSILDNISEGVLVTGADLELESYNPAAERLLGENCRYLNDAAGGNGIFNAENSEPVGLAKLLAQTSANDGPVEYVELLIVNPAVPAGKYVAFSARQLARAKKDSWVIVLHDLTAEKASREQLLKANQELDAFCYSISHDLRAPLRSLTGFSQILVEDFGKKLGPEAIRICNVIVRAAEKMGRLIDDLLKFSRITRHDIIRSRINMEELFRNVIERLRTERGEIKHQISVAPMPGAFADPQLMQQVVYNLLSNAVKYSAQKPDPVIKIGARTIDGETAYYITDNGEGFDMRYYHKLFEVFQRLHSDREFEGTGVGLSIVKRIIERHQGRIWAEAIPGQGATFYFTLNTENQHSGENVTVPLHGNTNIAH